MCKPKHEGGMSFREMEAFNFVLLAKQGWHLLQQPRSLVGRVLSAKYHHNVSFMEAKLEVGVSFAWRSIIEVKKLLKQGLR